MALSLFWCFCVLIGGSLAGHHVEGDTNLFYDVLLEERLPKSVRSLHYDPVELPSFSVQLENVTDFKADLRRGLLHGLSGSLHRRGDCGPYIWRGANVTVDCVLRMNGLRVSYDGVTKQRNNSTEFKLDVDVEETTVFMQVTGRLKDNAALKDVNFGDFNFRIKLSKVLNGLNGEAAKEFENVVGHHLKRFLMRVVYFQFTVAAKEATSTVIVPKLNVQ